MGTPALSTPAGVDSPRPSTDAAWPAARLPRRMEDGGVTEVIGTILLLAVSVALAGAFVIFLFTAPPPTPESHVDVATFILPNDPTTLVLEHRGGESIALSDLQVTLTLAGTATTAKVGERIAAADPAWSVVATDGTAKAATARFQPGDQVRYTSATVQGASVEVFLADSGRQSEVMAALAVQAVDATAPVLSSARTTSTTTVEVTFSEPLLDVAASDFTIGGATPSAVRILGNGTVVEFTVAAMATSATPSVNVVANAGTHDLANNPVTNPQAIVAADATPPTITLVSSGTPTSSGTTVTWTTSELANATVYFGVGPHLGRVATGASDTSHSVALSQLSELTLYWFAVASTDAALNTATTAGTPFITADDGSGGGGGSSGMPSLALTPPATTTAGTQSAAWTVTYRDSTGSPATPSSPVTVYLSTNSTAAEFRDPTTSAKVQTVTISGASSTTFRYYDERAGIPTVLAAAVGVVGDARSYTVDDVGVAAWRVQATGRQVAGTEFTVVLEAVDAFGNLDNEYATSTSFKFAGAGVVGGNLPKAGVATADTNFGTTTGAFTFVAGRTTVKMLLFANETADVVITDTTSAFTNAKAPFRVVVGSGATMQLEFSPYRPVSTKGLWAGPFFVVAEDTHGNNVTQLADRTVTVGGTGVTFSATPGGSGTTTFTIPAGSPRVGFFLKSDTASTGVALSATAAGVTAGAATLYVNDLAAGSSSTPFYLNFTAVGGRSDAGSVSGLFTVKLFDQTGAEVAPSTPRTIYLATNSTDGVFLDPAGTTIVSTLTISSTSGASFRYLDTRQDGGPSSLAVSATNTIPERTLIYITPRGSSTSIATVQAFLMLNGAMEQDNTVTPIGMSIVNPTGTAITVTSVTFTATLNIGTGTGTESFFRATRAVAVGSDDAWETCNVGTATSAQSITCTPTSAVSVPAFSATQVILTFQTSTLNNFDHTIVAGSATTSIGTLSTVTKFVRHTSAGPHFTFTPIDGAGGNVIAGYGTNGATTVTGGASTTFNWRWNFQNTPSSATNSLSTTITIPRGWSGLSIADQSFFTNVGTLVTYVQPTADDDGFVRIIQNPPTTSTVREFFFTATPPDIVGVDRFIVDQQDSVAGANNGELTAYRVAVRIS